MKSKLLLIIGLFLIITSCEKITDERVWVAVDPVQCMGNAWEKDWLEENNDDYELWRTFTIGDELDIIEKYYEELGIIIYDIKQENVYDITCEACGCPRGDRISCFINKSDVGQMLEWGFIQE